MNFAGFVRTHEPERNCVHLNDPVSRRIKLQTRKINMIIVKYSIVLVASILILKQSIFMYIFMGNLKMGRYVEYM